MKLSDIKYFLTIHFLTKTTQNNANFVDVDRVLHFLLILHICTFQRPNFTTMKDELKFSHNGGRDTYILKSIAMHFNHT